MPSTTTLTARLQARSDDDRLADLQAVHALHQQYVPVWRKLLDAYEGSGGFLDGSYLWRYPNEVEKEFRQRQEQARYHNFVKTLVNLFVRHVFREGVKRDTTDERLIAFWANADGAGRAIDVAMKRAAKMALPIGHVGLLLDKTQKEASGPSRADEKAEPFLALYLPQAILDWRQNRHDDLLGVKLLEDAPQEDILAPPPHDVRDRQQYLIWTQDEWARFDGKGEFVEDAVHNLSVVPLIMLRPEPSAAQPFLGQSLIGNANVVTALYNRCSEEDEVLREQAFSILTVNVPVDGDVEKVKAQIGTDVGPTRALVAQGSINYITADMGVAATIRDTIAFLIQEIYRAAHVRFQRDSLDSESAEAIRLQHTELNEMLAGLAAELTSAEKQICRVWFAWMQPGDLAAAEQAMEAAQVSITYPREFFTRDLVEDIKMLADAFRLQLGETFEKRAKKRLARQMDPDADGQTRTQIEEEIDQLQTAGATMAQDAAEQLRQSTQKRLAAFTKPFPVEEGAAA